MQPTASSPDATQLPVLRVRVVGQSGGYGLVAAQPSAAGDVLCPVDGTVTARPSRFSIQIDDDRHIDLGTDVGFEDTVVRHPWRFLNHSCEPNAAYRARAFVALRSIQAGEAVTFDYDTTELDMAVAFDCGCGSSQCRGRISGFAHLPLEGQLRLRPLLADHLMQRLYRAAPNLRA